MPQALQNTRINISRLVNTQAARKEVRNGREIIIVPSATMPDDIIMNRILYPAEEIKKSYKTLNNTPAPVGHPIINGQWISAKDPEGLNQGWIGAWNENARHENNKVYIDKVIDVERAEQSENGRRVLDAVDKGEPIETSTGALAMVETVRNHDDYDMIARDIVFDHDAILLDNDAAAKPEQGVGIFVNSKGEKEEIKVINSVWEDTDREIDWALDSIARALERQTKVPVFERMKAAVTEAFSSFRAETTTNQKEDEMSKEQLDELSTKVDALTESLKDIGTTITNGVSEAFTNALKPLVDAQEAVLANEKAKEEEEKGKLIDSVVKANLLNEEAAEATPIETLRSLVANIKAQTAASVRPGKMSNNSETVTQFKAPSAKKEA